MGMTLHLGDPCGQRRAAESWAGQRQRCAACGPR